MTLVALTIVIVMYLVNFALWIIDLHNIVEELNTTLVSDFPDSLEQRYALSGDKSLRLEIVEDVLFSYMVRRGKLLCLTLMSLTLPS